jgi:hypothetical protein
MGACTCGRGARGHLAEGAVTRGSCTDTGEAVRGTLIKLANAMRARESFSQDRVTKAGVGEGVDRADACFNIASKEQVLEELLSLRVRDYHKQPYEQRSECDALGCC